MPSTLLLTRVGLVALLASCAASTPLPDAANRAPAPGVPSCVAAPDIPPFDRKIALEELTKATDEAASCAGVEGPQGAGRVAVVFLCDGRTVSAEVEVGTPGGGWDPGVGPALHGTPAERCVQTSYLKIQVPPFGGKNVTVHKTFRLTPAPSTAAPAASGRSPTGDASALCTMNFAAVQTATVRVDDVERGTTPVLKVLLPPGDHSVVYTFADPSLQEKRTSARCNAGEVKTVAVRGGP